MEKLALVYGIALLILLVGGRIWKFTKQFLMKLLEDWKAK